MSDSNATFVVQPELHHRRCANHAQREAAARCPECKRFFCRECITEHESRVLCATCLAKILAPGKKGKARFRGVFRFAQLAVGFFVAWLVFYALGDLLLRIPTSFHEGEVWKKATEW